MKLQAFLICEKIIIDQQGFASLITIMDQVTANIPPGATPPEEAIVPNNWSLAAMWRMSPEDEPGEFIQRTQIFWPSGKLFSEKPYTFTPTPPDGSAFNFLNITGVPVGQTGKIRIAAWVEKDGNRITETVEAFLMIKHATQVVPETAQAE